jgi:hypothetical protein
MCLSAIRGELFETHQSNIDGFKQTKQKVAWFRLPRAMESIKSETGHRVEFRVAKRLTLDCAERLEFRIFIHDLSSVSISRLPRFWAANLRDFTKSNCE